MSPHAGCLRASGRGCLAACPGGHLIRPLLVLSGAATKARPATPRSKWSSWRTMTGAQGEPPQTPRGLNPLQCLATPPARDTHSDGAPMDGGCHTPPNSPWGLGRATAPVVRPHIQILPVQLPSCLAQPNLPGGQPHTRLTALLPPD